MKRTSSFRTSNLVKNQSRHRSTCNTEQNAQEHASTAKEKEANSLPVPV
jgi:hypothetical protein